MRLFSAFLIPVLFFLSLLLTLSDYGINWDEPKHLIRGQSYLQLILTGRHDFLDLPPYRQLKGAPDYVDFNVDSDKNINQIRIVGNPDIRRSYFQSDFYTLDYFLTKHMHTHPEVNGLLAASTNFVFFQKLGLMGDIESHHLFVVLVVFALAIVVALWTYINFGIIASLVASASLAMYPLVFSETHFNVKDPPLMAFFGLAVLTFWFGFSRGRFIYILLSAIFAGFALGTKFNAVFLPLILGLWLLFKVINYRAKSIKKTQLLTIFGGWKVIISILAYPLIMLGILFIFSPYLWADPIRHFTEIVKYYKDIGLGTPDELSAYLIGGWNTYPLVWILYTTPLPILFLSVVGFGYSIFLILRKKMDAAFLILVWFSLPIIRVIWPGTNIYGGIRQIMEFIPAMAILAGIGAYSLTRFIVVTFPRTKLALWIATFLIMISFSYVVYELAYLHPNQNVYFNQLIGGLSGAKEKNIPSWGNTYGNVYLQGINWLNENAEPNAKLTLAVNYISVVPRIKLRDDIDLDNNNFSGPDHNGEYVMEMNYDWPLKSRYRYAYYETFLDPVYQVVIDGVPLLKIWKNEISYIKPGYEHETEIIPTSVTEELDSSSGALQKKVKINFANDVFLTRLLINHSNDDCNKKNNGGFVVTSRDQDKWIREPDLLIDPESPEGWMGSNENTFVFMFPARLAKYMIVNSEMDNPCILKDYQITIIGLQR